MGFTKLIEEEYKKIEEKTIKEKQEVYSLVSLFKKNYDEILKVCSFDENLSQEAIMIFLFGEFKDCLFELKRYSTPGGHFMEEGKLNSLVVKLGWVENIQINPAKQRFKLELTEKGREIYSSSRRNLSYFLNR